MFVQQAQNILDNNKRGKRKSSKIFIEVRHEKISPIYNLTPFMCRKKKLKFLVFNFLYYFSTQNSVV